MSSVEMLKEECEDAAKQIITFGAKLNDVGGIRKLETFHVVLFVGILHIFLLSDRLRLCQWLRLISQLRNDRHESLKMKHEYLEFLLVMLDGPYKKLTKPFDALPPENLVPLAECIANRIADYYQDLVPRVGNFQKIPLSIYDFLKHFFSLVVVGQVLCSR